MLCKKIIYVDIVGDFDFIRFAADPDDHLVDEEDCVGFGSGMQA